MPSTYTKTKAVEDMRSLCASSGIELSAEDTDIIATWVYAIVCNATRSQAEAIDCHVTEEARLNRESQNLSDQLGACGRDLAVARAEIERLTALNQLALKIIEQVLPQAGSLALDFSEINRFCAQSRPQQS